MRDRTARRISRALILADVVLLVPALWITWLNRSDANTSDVLSIVGFILAMCAFSAIGFVMATRLPRNFVGWGFLLIPCGFLVNVAASEWAKNAILVNPGSLPFAQWAAWLSAWVFVPFVSLIPMIILLFPTGHTPGPRWRPVLWLIGVGILAGTIGTALRPGTIVGDPGVVSTNPMGLGSAAVWELLQRVGGITVIAGALLSVAGMVVRYVRSRGDERQQLRWFVSASVVALLIFIAAFITSPSNGAPSRLSDVLFTLFLLCLGIGVPGASAVAILRYRLYDLDLVIKKTVLFATVAVLLSAVFLVVLVAAGGLLGHGGIASVIAAAAIGLSFWPTSRLARRIANRVVYGRRASPYEVVTTFASRMSETYGSEDVLPRLALILRDGVGAERATVWLRIGAELRPVAIAPTEFEPPAPVPIREDELPPIAADAAVEVRDAGELLGALAVEMPANDPIDPTRERLLRDLASQTGLVLRNVRLVEELRASRRRLVAAQDQERRRIERNIHDGAQQQLVALAVQLRLLEQTIDRDANAAKRQAGLLQTAANETLEDLRDLARGIYPPLLADQGLQAALEAQARKAPLPVVLHAEAIDRLGVDAETAVYFCVLEAINNVAKYARADAAAIRLSRENGALLFQVEDDGVGFDLDATTYGTGLQGMADRLEAIGGSLSITSAPGAGTIVSGSVPAIPA